MNDTTIISAFPGCGKTYASGLYGIPDLDRREYYIQPDWVDRYIERIRGDVVFIIQRPELLRRIAGAIMVAPYPELKDEWLEKRILARGYKPEWFDLVADNWDILTSDRYFMQFAPKEIVRLGIDEYISDIIGRLL